MRILKNGQPVTAENIIALAEEEGIRINSNVRGNLLKNAESPNYLSSHARRWNLLEEDPELVEYLGILSKIRKIDSRRKILNDDGFDGDIFAAIAIGMGMTDEERASELAQQAADEEESRKLYKEREALVEELKKTAHYRSLNVPPVI